MRFAVVVLVLGAATAHADPKPANPPIPDPSALDAADANLETKARRSGRSLTLAAGGGLTVGFGIEDAVGRGPAASLRLGQVATARTVLTIEIASVTQLGASSGDRRSLDTNLLLGAQYYVTSALWVRLAGGIGTFRGDTVGTSAVDVSLAGPAGAFGAGLDLVRWRRVAIGMEMISIAMLNREGMLSSSGLLLNVSVD